MLKRSKFKIGEFLVTTNGNIFIHDGYENGDGYGCLIGMSSDGTILKQSDLVNLQLSLNAQEIINIAKLRLCSKASKETREVWYKVLDKLACIEPLLASACVPQCVYRGFCPEPKTCNRTKTNIFSFMRKYYKSLEIYPSNL
jgi:hypothetical protein